MSTFLSHFLENTQPRTRSPVENYCSRSHKRGRRPGRLVRPAVVPGRGAVLPSAAQTWWCQTHTQCMPATSLLAWFLRCLLYPAAEASSPKEQPAPLLGYLEMHICVLLAVFLRLGD